MGITDGWTEAKATNVVAQLQISPRLKDRTGCLDMSCLLHSMFGLCCSATRVKDPGTGLTTLVGVFDQTKLRGLCLNFIMHLTRRIEYRLIVVFDGPDPRGSLGSGLRGTPRWPWRGPGSRSSEPTSLAERAPSPWCSERRCGGTTPCMRIL